MNSDLEPSTQESGREASATVLANNFGPMALNISASGGTTVLMEKENSSTLMAIFMKDSGQMTRRTVQESISMSTELCTRVSGRTTYSMERE